MKMPTVTDSRGRESTTLTFVAVSWAVVVLRFAVGGLSFGEYGTIEATGAGEFGAAVALILGIWLGREWTEKQ